MILVRNFFQFFLLFSVIIPGQDLSFFQEDITFKLDENYFKVMGYYWFANQSDKDIVREIYFPVLCCNYNTKTDSIEVIDVKKNKTSKIFIEGKKGFFFKVDIQKKDTCVYKICYRQKVNSDSAVYILESTQTWGNPLKIAEYKLVTNKEFLVKRFSYPPEKEYIIQENKIYFWKRINFMPEKNMIFYF